MRKIPAFFVVACLAALLTPSSNAQRRISESSPLDTLGKNPSQETGWEILKRFRSFGWDGGYHWRVQLKNMPRREKTWYLNGEIYGDRLDRGPISRIDIVEQPIDVDENGNQIEKRVLRLLLQSGQNSYAMGKRTGEAGPPFVFDSEAALEPIAGSEFSLFDLLAPFVYWPKFRYEGRTTFRGSPTHLFWMYPPEEDSLLNERIGGVRIFINDQFNVLTQTEIFDTGKTKLKTIYIIGVDKADGQTIFRELDVRNEVTRDKTRLKILDAKMGLELPTSLFTAQSLMDDLQNQTIPIVRQEAFESLQ
jgi:hypothetical protein